MNYRIARTPTEICLLKAFDPLFAIPVLNSLVSYAGINTVQALDFCLHSLALQIETYIVSVLYHLMKQVCMKILKNKT